MPLGLLGSGDRAEIVCIQGGGRRGHGHGMGHGGFCPGEESRMEQMGIRVGKKVHVLNNEGRGLLLIKVDESRIAMSRGMAMKILVERRG